MSDLPHEFALIQWIRQRAGEHSRLPIGIGDDTAALRFSKPTDCLLTVDMLMEGTHFRIPPVTAHQIGRKALAVNLSDIAAMAGKPLAAVVSVAVPRRLGSEFACELHGGLCDLADEFHVALAGGDTNVWDGPLVVSVTLVGEPTGSGAVTRSGAKVGDWILTTGEFGGSLAGKHLSFQPRIDAAIRLHQRVSLHALIDVSDGLAADLHHLLEESRVGAVLDASAIPVSEVARTMDDGKTPLEHALGDGEDFELLFTISPSDGSRLLADSPVDVPLAHIGEIVAGNACELIDADGHRQPLEATGWRHTF